MLASVSANTIILFTIFGGLMDAFGAIGAIMNVAMSASTKIRSGGAQVAVVSAGLIGSITGSVAANITLTGSVCMPLMRKRGYSAEFTAATEAAASTGGAILPPVMNAAAFIIASWTGIPYITLVFVGVTPALLYYLGISLSVYIKACKLGDEKMKKELLPQFHHAYVNLMVFLIPLVLLVTLMIMGESPRRLFPWLSSGWPWLGCSSSSSSGKPIPSDPLRKSSWQVWKMEAARWPASPWSWPAWALWSR